MMIIIRNGSGIAEEWVSPKRSIRYPFVTMRVGDEVYISYSEQTHESIRNALRRYDEFLSIVPENFEVSITEGKIWTKVKKVK